MQAELLKELDNGFLKWSSSKQALERQVGKLVQSRIGAVVAVKGDKTKTRSIHDLRRSLINAMCKVQKESNLPRLLDAAYTMLSLMLQQALTDEECECIVIDFSDAFKHLRVCFNERRFMAGSATMQGQIRFFYYIALLFGAV